MNPGKSSLPSGLARRAGEQVALLFKANGWKIQSEPMIGPDKADLLVRKGRNAYLIEIKAISEGRSDRVIPLLSQAILQAQAYSQKKKVRPLAVVYVRDASQLLFGQIERFSRQFAPDVSVGIVSEGGGQYFWGEGLAGLNVQRSSIDKGQLQSPAPASHLFSDLNQWMLKVLLAPRIPEHLLSAPRSAFRNASELASAANVSVMSAFRFVSQLREEGFLDESSPHLKLVRREALFQRWHSAVLRPSRELPMRFLIRGAQQSQVREFVLHSHGCLGLFAAADALKFGHVKGAVPYVYVRGPLRMDRNTLKGLSNVSSNEAPDMILKQARAPQSLFRGAVQLNGVSVSDILQVWLDVSSHPSRGEEQAKLIYRKVLAEIVDGGE
ncbi:MAG TPA: RpiR family transcriptional regulator [Burkholderiales bacterium]|nr:RpiR family transcriptional regulator [Burkholderiales bacterium]